MAGVEIPREAFGSAWWHLVAHMRRFVRIRVDVSSIWPFMIPRGERGTGSENPSQLGTERQPADVCKSSMTGRSCLLLTSSSRIAFGVGLRVDVSMFGNFRASSA